MMLPIDVKFGAIRQAKQYDHRSTGNVGIFNWFCNIEWQQKGKCYTQFHAASHLFQTTFLHLCPRNVQFRNSMIARLKLTSNGSRK
jgi:hypothetical protein